MVQILNTQDGTINLVTGEEYIVPDGALLTASGNSFSLAGQSGIVLVIEGTVFAGGGDGTTDDGSTDDIEVLVGRDGSVWAWSDGLEFSGTGVTVRNLGSIVGAGDSGVEMTGADSLLSNSGTIEGVGHGVQTADATSITNSGLITGERGVDMRGGNTVLVNSGTIQSPGRVETLVESAGVYFYGGNDFVIRNTGLISGPEFAIRAPADESNDAAIHNDGTLDGDVILNGGVQSIDNSGGILGNVALAAGDDVYNGIGDGFTTGVVNGGSGNDTLLGGDIADELLGGNNNDLIAGRGGQDTIEGGNGDDTAVGGEGDDNISGDAGDDVLNGDSGNDALFGSDGNDTIRGGDGQDRLEGGADDDALLGLLGDDVLLGDGGQDLLLGGSGNDELYGGNASDRLAGGGDDDTLRGEAGNDTLLGNNGDDELIGGLGVDVLTGGAGADVFLFETQADSGFTNATADTIRDFEVGVDKIDLSGAVGAALDFIGTSGFSGSGAELRLQLNANTTFVDIDFDGNGSRDARIVLTGSPVLTEDDFIL